MGEQLEILVRKTTEIDLETIAAIALQLYPNHFNGESRVPLAEARKWVKNLSSGDHGQYLVAEYDGKIVGYSYSMPLAHGAGVIAVIEFGAIPVKGVRGIGTKVIEATVALWQNEHYERFGKPLTSMLIYTGEPGVKLCTKQGFQVVAEMEDLYGPGVHEFVVRKDFRA